MLIISIAARFLAAGFACIGLYNCRHCIQNATPGAEAAEFFAQLAMAAWPLAAAVVMELLLQIVNKLELLGIRLKDPAPLAAPAPAKKVSPLSSGDKASPAPAPHAAEPASAKPAAPQKKEEGELRFFKID